MASLRKLITSATEGSNEEDVAELAKFAKNFLPLLFNLYTTKPNGSDEDGQRLAALETIKVCRLCIFLIDFNVLQSSKFI